jgi:hypothetical protein
MHIIIRLLKLATVNILVFLGMLIFINLAAISIYQLCNMKIFSGFDTDPRSRLPNYKNIEWASIHFKELHELQREYRSYIGWRHLPYKGQTINIDEKGIRITPQSKLAKGDSPLVVFLGGSTMWGDGVDDANTIPALFAQIAKGRYRTMNLGETGYTAFQSYLFFKMQIIDGLKPDAVVSYDGVNDALALYPGLRPFSHLEESRIRKAMKEQHIKEEEALSFRHYFQDPLKCFISHYKITDSDSEDYYLFLSNDRIEKAAEALLEGWLSTKDLAEKNGAVFIGILQPNPAIGEPYGEHLKFKKEKYLPFYKNFYPAVLKLLKTPKYEEMSNNVIVLTNIFDLKEPIYIDDCHVSPNGNKIIAEKIYYYINNFADNKTKSLHLPNRNSQF